MAFKEYIKKQLKSTAITGIPQIIEVRGIVRKLLKSVVFIGCLAGCIYQIWEFMLVYWTYPTIVDVTVSSPKRIALPAVTVCPYNGILASAFCEEFPEYCTPARLRSDFCFQNFHLCRNNKEAENGSQVPVLVPEELPTQSPVFDQYGGLRKYYSAIGVERTTFISQPKMDGVEIDPQEFSVFNTLGLPTNCFAFNTKWGNASAEPHIVSTRSEVKMKLTVDTEDNFYENTPMAIQVAVHSSFEAVNPFQDGFSIKPCTSYRIYIKMTEKYLLPPPYPTNCTDYFAPWRARGGKGPLSEKACADECLFNISMSRHSCFNPMYVTYPNEAMFCYSQDKIPLEEDYVTCAQRCSSACYDETMQVDMEEFIFAESGDSSDDKTSCGTYVDFSLIRMEVITFSYKSKYESIELFSYIGGYLGMWLGMSLIAACDFFETCVMILLHCIKREKRRRKSSKIKNALKVKLPADFPAMRMYSNDLHTY